MLTVVLVALALPVLVGHDQYFVGIACLAVIFALAATGWNYVSGFAGSMSVGHAAFFGVGAYTAAISHGSFELNAWVCLLLAGFITSLLSLGLGLLSFRVTGPYFALTTVACAEIIRLAVRSVDQVGDVKVGGARGLALSPDQTSFLNLQFDTKEGFYFTVLAILVVTLLATFAISRSRFGLYWAAIRTDPAAAASLGVPVLRYRSYASLFSGLIAGLAGGIYAFYVGFVDSGRVLGIELSVELLIYGMIGGRATVLGPAIGALILFPLGEFIRAETGSSSGLHFVIFGLLLMASVYRFPSGIVGMFSRRVGKTGAGR